MNLSQPIGGGKKKAGKLPVGKKINFAQVGQKPSQAPKVALGVVIAAVAIALFAKFAVIDRIDRVATEQGKAAVLRQELEAKQASIAELENLPGQYYHYTLSGMTEEELSRVTRADVSELVLTIADRVISMDSFRLTGNNLSISVTARALGDITQLVADLQQDPLVETISLTTAQSNEQEARTAVDENGNTVVVEEEISNVKAQLNLFLTKDADEEGAS